MFTLDVLGSYTGYNFVVFVPVIFNVVFALFNDKLTGDVCTFTLHFVVFPFWVVAVITAVPFETPITVPSFPTDAILELLLDHFTTFCTFAVLGNIVEVNCIDLGFAVKSSVTLFLFNCIPIGDVCTVTNPVAVLLFSVVTLTVAVPFERPVTTPFDEIDITFGLLELSISHLNPILAFAVLGYIVVAYWCVFTPLISNTKFSESKLISNGVDITTTFHVAALPFSVVAVIVTSPFEIPVTNPLESTTATSLLLLVQVIPVL